MTTAQRIDQAVTAEDAAKKQRRKIQNRKNQRAHRSRVGDKRQGADKADKQDRRPYNVGRWRLDEVEPTTPDVDLKEKTSESSPGIAGGDLGAPSSSTALVHRSHRPATPADIARASFEVVFPLSTDHLVHIIQYNVLRGLRANKTSFNILTGQANPANPENVPCRHRKAPVPRHTFVPGPEALIPTTLQMTQSHAAWIDMIPFPKVRDTLIRFEPFFDHLDFLRDLVGDTGGYSSSTEVDGDGDGSFDCWSRLPAYTLSVGKGAKGRDPDSQHGLVVWGEPHDMRNWELTPGFLAKWSWVLDGSEELIEISNHWRRVRGEGLIRVAPVQRFGSGQGILSV